MTCGDISSSQLQNWKGPRRNVPCASPDISRGQARSQWVAGSFNVLALYYICLIRGLYFGSMGKPALLHAFQPLSRA